MVLDQKIVLDNNLIDTIAMIMECLNKLEGKSVEPPVTTINTSNSGSAPIVQQPQ